MSAKTRAAAPTRRPKSERPPVGAQLAARGGSPQLRIARATASEERAWQEARARATASAERVTEQAREAANDERAWQEALQQAKARVEADEAEAWQAAMARAQAACAEAEEREWATRMAQARALPPARPAAARSRARQAPAKRGPLVFWP